jgi:multiple sugar transport system ATP-binding protein
LELAGVSHSYGDVLAVEDVSLRVDDGEFVVLLGPSGCGKSTTLRLIAGLESPTAGEIKIGGRVVNGVSTQERDIAFVFQSYALYPHMTVAKNLEFPLRMRSVPPPDRAEAARRVAEHLGLDGLLGRYPGQLSGGQRQRVALGRAIVREPAAFLLDEPLSNLDAQLRSETRVGLVRLQRELGGTFIFVTHDQVEAMTLADRVAVMKDGSLQQYAPPEVIYDDPANTFVAGFVGSPRMNLIEGRVNHDGVFESAGLRLSLNGNAGQTPEGPLVLGFRGVDVVLGDEGSLSARIDVVEPLGDVTHVYAVLGEGQTEQVVLSLPNTLRPREGEVLKFDIPPRAIKRFEPETGRRLGS